jgi:subtilase family serine protease
MLIDSLWLVNAHIFMICNIHTQGTSMATPATAGTAALLRQILVDGHHETFSSAGFAGSNYSVNVLAIDLF